MMMSQKVEIPEGEAKAQYYLYTLCSFEPDRRTGSAGNRAATDFFARKVEEWGYEVDATPFPCMDHRIGEVSLHCGGSPFPVKASPFSPGCEVAAQLMAVTTVAELEKSVCAGKILLMRGEICAEQLMPKNFPFYNPEHHKKLYALLEEKKPAAIITAVKKSPEQVGALYPYPLIEDGDFDIPSVYCTETTGEEIAAFAGKAFELKSDAQRIPSEACNVIARKNPGAKKKILVCAHIDTKEDTPGALDDASGSVVELLLAEMLAKYEGTRGIEIVAFNGEDNYSAAGQKDYLRRYGDGLDSIVVAVNIDDVGYIRGKDAYSFYDCPDGLMKKARDAFGRHRSLMEGPPWFQGDHMIFAQKGIPAMAFTSRMVAELMSTVTHSREDTPELVDCRKLVEIAAALRGVIVE